MKQRNKCKSNSYPSLPLKERRWGSQANTKSLPNPPTCISTLSSPSNNWKSKTFHLQLESRWVIVAVMVTWRKKWSKICQLSLIGKAQVDATEILLQLIYRLITTGSSWPHSHLLRIQGLSTRGDYHLDQEGLWKSMCPRVRHMGLLISTNSPNLPSQSNK